MLSTSFLVLIFLSFEKGLRLLSCHVPGGATINFGFSEDEGGGEGREDKSQQIIMITS